MTPEQRAANRVLSQQRISVEHAIGGIKVHQIAAERLRTPRDGFADLAMEVATGLYNDKSALRDAVTHAAA